VAQARPLSARRLIADWNINVTPDGIMVTVRRETDEE
jgi:hypothetical protein